MKRIALALITGLFAASTFANYQCPIPPWAPYGCHHVCVCDSSGNNCRLILVCNK
jgi:hypothetical protein